MLDDAPSVFVLFASNDMYMRSVHILVALDDCFHSAAKCDQAAVAGHAHHRRHHGVRRATCCAHHLRGAATSGGVTPLLIVAIVIALSLLTVHLRGTAARGEPPLLTVVLLFRCRQRDLEIQIHLVLGFGS